MKRKVAVGAFASLLGLGVALGLALMMVLGGVAHAAGPAKIGYVDLQRTLNETKVGKAAKGRLESEKKRRQKELDGKQAALKKEAEELERKRTVLKPDAARAKEREIQEKYVALQQTFLQFQQELTKREAQLTRDIFSKAANIITAIAKRDGYTMIIEKNEGAVLYADPTVDITAEVNRRLDAGEGGSAAAPKKK